jgi:4-hydroxy-2-oxoheptanedioate aldolase
MINTAKQRMLRGEPAFGFSLGLGSVLSAEILSRTKIDFLLLETQHGSWGGDSAIAALAAMSGGSAIPMTRVAKNDYTLIGQLLDQGVLGVVVPMIDTVEQAEAVASACRLPPKGTRSWGLGRARIWGDDYADTIDEQLFVAVQIESITAVENAEAIMAVEGIDGCWAGPADMALSMGVHPRDIPKSDKHAKALERVVQACRNTGKIAGLACNSAAEARRRVDEGFQFLTAGSDAGFITAGAAEGLKIMGR